jgi:hypothetical protein
MPDLLHYPGAVTNYDPDYMLGPDLHGRRLIIKSLAYDADTDVTTATLRAVLPDEHRERVLGDGGQKEQAQARTRLARLFHG